MPYVSQPFSTVSYLPSNLGGYKAVSLYLSSEIVQQLFQSESTIEAPLIFKKCKIPIFERTVKHFDLDLSLGNQLAENGLINLAQCFLTFDAQGNEGSFLSFYRNVLQNRRICLEVLTMEGVTLILNPFYATYRYVGAINFTDTPRIELLFTRAKFYDYANDDFKVINRILVITVNYVGTLANEVTILLKDGVTMSLFEFGYSLTNDIETVNFQNDPFSNVLQNLADGIYYFFAYNRKANLYDVMQAKLEAGIIIPIEESNLNTYQVDEDSTIPDEGTIVPE